MIQSVIGNHTPIAFSSMPPAAAAADQGRQKSARPFCGDQRPSAASRWPDVPTMAEAGVPDQEGDTPQGILVPKGRRRRR